MPTSFTEKLASILDPTDRNAEVLFGLLMCLTFTGTISVATAGHEQIYTMELAAIGCNAAWGLVDSVMHIMRTLVVRSHLLHLVRAVRLEPNPASARAIIASDLRPLYLRVIGDEGLERIRAEMLALPKVPARPSLNWQDFHAAIMIFLLVFLSTFPVVLPFMIFEHLPRAMRFSGAIAIAMMFLCGYSWGKHAGVRPMRAGLAMVVIGTLLEVAIILLGG